MNTEQRTLLFNEIMKTANEIDTLEDRVRFLRSYDSKSLRILIKAGYNSKIQWDLPEGSVPFMAIEGPARTNLLKASQDLYVFIKGGADAVPQLRKQSLFIQLLESVSPEEAEILIFMKDKAMEELFPNITMNVIELAFPTTLQ